MEGLSLNDAIWQFSPEDVVSRRYAKGVPERLVPFAADVFGDLFCFDGDAVRFVLTETGEVQDYAADRSEWQAKVLADPDSVGAGLCKAWASVNGRLKPGSRLTPKMPFIFGGSGRVDDLVALELSKILEARQHIAEQLKGVPDDGRVMLNLIE